MTLAAFGFLARVIAPDTTAFRGFDALASLVAARDARSF
jgi:hypothetical protein